MILIDIPVLFRGLKFILTKWDNTGFGRDLRELMMMLQAGNAKQAESEVISLSFSLSLNTKGTNLLFLLIILFLFLKRDLLELPLSFRQYGGDLLQGRNSRRQTKLSPNSRTHTGDLLMNFFRYMYMYLYPCKL